MHILTATELIEAKLGTNDIRQYALESRYDDPNPDQLILHVLEAVQNVLVESRIDFIKKKWRERGVSTDHDLFGKATTADDLVQHFADNADPSKNKQYTDRIMHWYNQGHIRQEDHHGIRSALVGFEKHRKNLPHQDIGRYGSFHELRGALHKLESDSAAAPEKAPEKGGFPWVKTTNSQRQAVQDGSEVVHEDEKHVVRRVDTHAAMKVLGSKTEWCVVPSETTFNSYRNEGPLYHVHEKHSGHNRRWLVHHESDQYMDEKDIDSRTKLERGDVTTLEHAEYMDHMVPGFDEEESNASEQIYGPENAHDIIHKSKNPWAVVKLAQNERMSPDVLHNLSTHKNPFVVDAVAGNPRTRSETLEPIVSRVIRGEHSGGGEHSAGTVAALVRHPSRLSKGSQEALVDHWISKGLEKKRESQSQKVFNKLSLETKHPSVMEKLEGIDEMNHNLGHNPNLTPQIAHRIAMKKAQNIKTERQGEILGYQPISGIFENPALSAESIEAAGDTLIAKANGVRDFYGRSPHKALAMLAKNNNCPESFAKKLAASHRSAISTLATMSHRLPEKDAQKILLDSVKRDSDDPSSYDEENRFIRREVLINLLRNKGTTDNTINFALSTLNRDDLSWALTKTVQDHWLKPPKEFKLHDAVARHPSPGVATKSHPESHDIHLQAAEEASQEALHDLAGHTKSKKVLSRLSNMYSGYGYRGSKNWSSYETLTLIRRRLSSLEGG